MQTHYDNNHQSGFIDALRDRAAKAEKAAASVITAGEKDEQELGSWKASKRRSLPSYAKRFARNLTDKHWRR